MRTVAAQWMADRSHSTAHCVYSVHTLYNMHTRSLDRPSKTREEADGDNKKTNEQHIVNEIYVDWRDTSILRSHSYQHQHVVKLNSVMNTVNTR